MTRRFLFEGTAFGVSSYKLMLYLGCVAGFYAGAQMARAAGMPEIRWILAATALLAVALAGARLLYLRAHPGPMWHRDAGGAALYGGLLASLFVSIPVLDAARLPFWRFWDAASITMLTGLIFTRVGCARNGCCAGRPTGGPLGFLLPDHRGEVWRRYPAQLLEAAWGGVVLAAVVLLSRPSSPGGVLFAQVRAGYGAGRFVLEQLREESRVRRFNTALSAALALGGAAAAMLWSWRPAS